MSDHRVRVICDGRRPESHEPVEVTRLSVEQGKFGRYARRCRPVTRQRKGRDETVWNLSCPTCRETVSVPEESIGELSRLIRDGGLITDPGGARSVSTRLLRGLLDRLKKGREDVVTRR